MSSKRDELKDKILALRMNEALKLPNAKKPEGDLPTGPLNASPNHPVGGLPTGENPSPEGNKPRGESTQTAIQPMGKLPSGNETQRATSPEGKRHQSRLETFIPSEQDEWTWRESNGELRIPHQLLEFAIRVTGSRNELCLFLFFIRFTLGFHRKETTAGYNFITQWTGISDVSTLKKSLRSLISKGLLRRLKEYDSATNRGTVYEVPAVGPFLTNPDGSGRAKNDSSIETINTVPSGQKPQRVNASATSGQRALHPVGNLPSKKVSNINKPLSNSQFSPILQTELNEIKAPAKRDAAEKILLGLLGKYSSTEIELALDHLKQHGILRTKEKCHSPFQYLSQAIEEVLKVAQATRDNIIPFVLPTSDNTAEVVTDQNQFDEATCMFQASMPLGHQTKIIQEYKEREYPHGYYPPSKIIERFAALDWMKSHQRCIHKSQSLSGI